jgi:hypothetical protein
MLEKQYKEAGPRGQREIIGAFNAEQSQIQAEQRRMAESERQTAAGKQQREDWFTQNAETLGKLPRQWQERISGSGSLPEAQAMFDRAMEERRQASMTLAERYPPAVLAGETAAVLGDVYAPFRTVTGRTRTLAERAEQAESAYKAAYGKGGRASKGAVSDAEMARSKLQERVPEGRINRALESVGIDLPPINPVELGIGTVAPYVAGNIPNAIDMLMGMLESDPAARDKVNRAFESATDPMQFLRAIGVGFGATALGAWGAGMKSDYGSTKQDARGVLKQFSARETAAKAAAAQKEEAKAKAALAKALKNDRSNVQMLKPQSALSPQDQLNILTSGGA